MAQGESLAYRKHGFVRSVLQGLSFCVGSLYALYGWGQSSDPYAFETAVQRRALLIGNSDYDFMGDLPGVAEDLKLAEKELVKLDFKVTVVSGVTSALAFEEDVLPKFRRDIGEGDIVVVYYSGHGFSYGPYNYFAPASLPLALKATEVSTAAISIEAVEDYLSKRKPGVVIVFVDACRSIVGFDIEPSGGNATKKGPSDPSGYQGWSNSIFAYASNVGSPALTSLDSKKPSYFSEALFDHVETQDVEFDSVFKDVIADVLFRTNETQRPGLYTRTSADLYLKQSDSLRAQQRELWRSVRDSNDRATVKKFLSRHSLSPYAAAAKKWLEDHPQDQADSFTLVSPVAVERVWTQSTPNQVLIQPTSTRGFALNRSIDLEAATASAGLSDAAIGLRQATGEQSPADLSSLFAAHQSIVAVKQFNARSAPTEDARLVAQIPRGTRLNVRGFESRADGSTWMRAGLAQTDKPVFLKLPSENLPSPTVRLGRAIQDVTIPAAKQGLPDLVDGEALQAALNDLHARGMTVTWVSVSAGKDANDRVMDARRLQIVHATHLLMQGGVDRTRITSLIRDDSGEGIRLRFFGY